MSWNPIAGLISGVVSPIAGIFSKREDRKLAATVGKNNLAQAKVKGERDVTMALHEWEAIMAEASKDSWKDEFWTIVLAGPFILLMIGPIIRIFTGDDSVMRATTEVLNQFKTVGLDYGSVLYVAIAAAFGFRWMKR